MEKHLILACSDGLVICRRAGADWNPVSHSLPGKHVTGVIAREGVILAGTTDGIFRTDDLGAADDCYCRAVWADPTDPQHLVLSPADGVDRNGHIEQTREGGHTWEPASDGLDVPLKRGMVERFVQIDDELLAVLSNGHLLSSPLKNLTWRRILPEVSRISAATTLASES